MELGQHRTLMIIAVAVVLLLVFSLVLQLVPVYPKSDSVTELYILGPEHKAENYPFNITRNENYHVILGITNHLGSSAHYQVEVKFRNESQSSPNTFTQSPSTLPSLYNIDATVDNNKTWELPVTFSIDYFSAGNDVFFRSMKFNDATLPLTGFTATYNSTTGVCYGNLVFELWLYNGTLQYNNRHVDLKFNMTITGV
jgi:uncharacterized membrane protein